MSDNTIYYDCVDGSDVRAKTFDQYGNPHYIYFRDFPQVQQQLPAPVQISLPQGHHHAHWGAMLGFGIGAIIFGALASWRLGRLILIAGLMLGVCWTVNTMQQQHLREEQQFVLDHPEVAAEFNRELWDKAIAKNALQLLHDDVVNHGTETEKWFYTHWLARYGSPEQQRTYALQ